MTYQHDGLAEHVLNGPAERAGVRLEIRVKLRVVGLDQEFCVTDDDATNPVRESCTREHSLVRVPQAAVGRDAADWELGRLDLPQRIHGRADRVDAVARDAAVLRQYTRAPCVALGLGYMSKRMPLKQRYPRSVS